MMQLLFEFVLAIASFTSLFYSRKLFLQLFFISSYHLFGSVRPAKYFYHLLIFPGVLVHELAHFFTAAALNVPTGEIEILPKEMEKGTRLGSVKVAKTDPLRTALIGVAPLLLGMLAIFVIIKIQFPFVYTQSLENIVKDFLSTETNWKSFAAIYLVFAVSNAMVLSPSDKQGFIPAAIITGVIIISIWVVPKPQFNNLLIVESLERILLSLIATFSFGTLINIFSIIPLAIIKNVFEKMSRRKVTITGN